MWYINTFISAFNTETKAEMLVRRGFFDGLFYVTYNNQDIADFRTWAEAKKFIERKVEEWNSADE